MKWFYRMALSEGKVLYSRKRSSGIPAITRNFISRRSTVTSCFRGRPGIPYGRRAEPLVAGDFRQTAFLTACAAEMLLHALYGVYYAADTDLHTLTTLLLRMRTISPELYLLLDPEQTSNSRMLSRLDVSPGMRFSCSVRPVPGRDRRIRRTDAENEGTDRTAV